MIRPIALAALLIGMNATVYAQAAPAWMVSEGSTLTFVAIQQGAPFQGRFDSFAADIAFAPDALESSRIVVTVELSSVNTQYAQRDEVLQMPEFFHVERWPRGRFEAAAFRALGGSDYAAVGMLTLRDQTYPLEVPFRFERDGAKATLTGEVVISRLRFGIGQGEWSDTAWIGADVTVSFTLNLER